MEYEFKSILLAGTFPRCLLEEQNKVLNKEFKYGWEYVDSICQSVSGDRNPYGQVIVILKRTKNNKF
jgi:hypothetical protein